MYLTVLDKSLYNGDFKNLENDNITMNWVKEDAFILLNVEPGAVKGIISNKKYRTYYIKIKKG